MADAHSVANGGEGLSWVVVQSVVSDDDFSYWFNLAASQRGRHSNTSKAGFRYDPTKEVSLSMPNTPTDRRYWHSAVSIPGLISVATLGCLSSPHPLRAPNLYAYSTFRLALALGMTVKRAPNLYAYSTASSSSKVGPAGFGSRCRAPQNST